VKISPADVNHFKSSQQAQAYQRSQTIIEDFRLLQEDLVQLDNHPKLDRNQDLGKVVLVESNLLAETQRKSRSFAYPPGPKTPERGMPTDRVFRLERRATGEAKWDPETRQLTSLRLEDSDDSRNQFRLSQGQSGGWLFRGQGFTTYEVSEGLPNSGQQREKLTVWQDGTLDYKFSATTGFFGGQTELPGGIS